MTGAWTTLPITFAKKKLRNTMTNNHTSPKKEKCNDKNNPKKTNRYKKISSLQLPTLPPLGKKLELLMSAISDK